MIRLSVENSWIGARSTHSVFERTTRLVAFSFSPWALAGVTARAHAAARARPSTSLSLAFLIIVISYNRGEAEREREREKE